MNKQNVIAGLSLVGLLGCGQESIQPEGEETIVEAVQTEDSILDSDCVVSVDTQRSVIFDNLLDGNLFDEDNRFGMQFALDKKEFATTVPDLAHDLFSGYTNIISLTEKERIAVLKKAKQLAYCLDTKINFENEVVKAAYESAERTTRESVDTDHKYAIRDIAFAKQVAADAKVDMALYAEPVVKAAYDKAERWTRGSVDTDHKYAIRDIAFAKQVAADAKIDVALYAKPVVKAAYDKAESWIRGSVDIDHKYAARDIAFAKQVAADAGVTTFNRRIVALEQLLQ